MFSASITLRAEASARTLNPTTIALDAAASVASVSVIAPTPEPMILTLTSSVDNLINESLIASSEPWTSDLITTFTSEISPSAMLANMFSNLAFCWRASFTSRNLPWRNKATSRAFFSSFTTVASSPEVGTPLKPIISTGIDGPADWIVLPFSSRIARTRPYSKPQSTSIVATGPRPLSNLDSTTTPLAILSTTAVSSNTSDCSNIESSKSSMPRPVLAETWQNWTSPPHSSESTPCCDNSFLTRSGSADSLSILLTAIMIGASDAWACWIASIVWGITPSSAATTMITISVALAPRERIAVKAAWPGVSKNVIIPWPVSTW